MLSEIPLECQLWCVGLENDYITKDWVSNHNRRLKQKKDIPRNRRKLQVKKDKSKKHTNYPKENFLTENISD